MLLIRPHQLAFWPVDSNEPIRTAKNPYFQKDCGWAYWVQLLNLSFILGGDFNKVENPFDDIKAVAIFLTEKCKPAIELAKKHNLYVIGIFEGRSGFWFDSTCTAHPAFSVMDKIDAFMPFTDGLTHFGRFIDKDKPSAFFDTPIPLSELPEKINSFENRKNVFIAGYFPYDNLSRDTLSSAFFAQSLGYKPSMTLFPTFSLERAQKYAWSIGLDCNLYPLVSFTDFVELLSQHQFALFFDRIGSVGRFPMTCAGAGTPCIHTKISDMANILFPALTIDHEYSYKQAEDIINSTLIKKEKFSWNAVANYARTYLESLYNDEKIKSNFVLALNKIGVDFIKE